MQGVKQESNIPYRRIATGLVLGVLLGVIGLPRLELPLGQRANVGPTVPEAVVVQAQPTVVVRAPAAPTPAPLPTPTPLPAPTAAPIGPRVVFGQRFVQPLANWPNDSAGNAWFADGAFRMFARQSGRFVAVGVPLPEIVSDAVITAQFHKVGGPPGGGYGLIVRDQGAPNERDSRTQAGRYLVLEVGDRGDVGIWRREETRWIDVMPWTHSDAVHLDREPNVMVVSMRVNTLRFEVNGELVADLEYDGLPPRGGLGIFVGGDLNEVALEWLRIEIS